MDDLISRSAVIEAIRMLSQENGYIELTHEDITDVIRALPPVRLELLKYTREG